MAALRLTPAGVIGGAPERALWPDSPSYIEPAEQMLAGNGYTDPQGTADLYRPPGYPVFLAAHELAFGDMILPTVFNQLLLGALIAALVGWLAASVWGAGAGAIAALLYLLTPNAVVWSMAILSDLLFVVFSTGAVACLAAFARSGHRRWAVAAGVLTGVGTLVRPIGLALVALWGLWLCLAPAGRPGRFRQAAVAAGSFIAACALVVLPWMIRNWRVHGLLTVSPISTWNLGRYLAPMALAADEGISLDEARAQVPTSRIPQPGERERYLSVLAQHPRGFLEAYLRGTWYILSEANLAQIMDNHSGGSGILTALRQAGLPAAWERTVVVLRDPDLRWIALLPAAIQLFQLVVYLLAIRACWLGFGPSPIGRWQGILVLVTALAFILLPGPVGNSRFRLPSEPMLAVMAALGLRSPAARAGAEAARPLPGPGVH